MQDLLGQVTVWAVIVVVFTFIFGGTILIILISVLKGVYSNLIACIKIKFNSNYQYSSHIQFRDRKNCVITGVHTMTTEIEDLDTNQRAIIRNEIFVQEIIWMNPKRRIKDGEGKQRIAS